MATTERPPSRLRAWMLEGLSDMGRNGGHTGPHAEPEPPHQGQRWWRVMCLTGVDYFSTLGYQPGIAALAAGLLSPVATIVLVIVTLAGALPVYRRVAEESPHGEGSIAMLERLLSFWQGKLFVLTLLGFAATDFLITITLSAADASTHLVENPHLTDLLQGKQMLITLFLVALLGAVFLKGFLEAVGVAVALVGVYLALNVVVVLDGLWHVITAGHVVTDWTSALTTEHGNVFVMVGVALIVFPKLALGLSGFETGVAVMPHIKGRLPARIWGAKQLLTTAAGIMSVFLITSSVVMKLVAIRKQLMIRAAVVSSFLVSRIRPAGRSSVSPSSPRTCGMTATPVSKPDRPRASFGNTIRAMPTMTIGSPCCWVSAVVQSPTNLGWLITR